MVRPRVFCLKPPTSTDMKSGSRQLRPQPQEEGVGGLGSVATKGIAGAVFGSVAMIGLSRRFFGCVANKRLTRQTRGI